MTFVIKSLANGQLPSSKGTLYTCPVGTTAIVRAITYTNTDASDRTVNLYFKESAGTSRRIVPQSMLLAVGNTMYWGDGVDVLTMEAGDIIEGDASAATVVDYVISGVERV